MTDPSGPPVLLVDTSVAVALCLGDHEERDRCVRAAAGHRLGLSGHAAFETFSVLTRLPSPARRTPAAASRMLAANFPATQLLDAEEAERLLGALPSLGLTGGAVYDALVGAAAAQHGLPLATRDRRALGTYRALGVELRLVG